MNSILQQVLLDMRRQTLLEQSLPRCKLNRLRMRQAFPAGHELQVSNSIITRWRAPHARKNQRRRRCPILVDKATKHDIERDFVD